MLKIEDLTKIYSETKAVDSLNLEVEPGDIVGFIGPNGAGKTTTIRIVSTLLHATSGKVFVDGVDIAQNPEAVRPLIGYMPDSFGLYEEVKVWEYLDFFASAYHLPKSDRLSAMKDVLELTDLSGKFDAYVFELSRGMQQRLCLAKTILHNPSLLLLDEPASGLDPRARKEIQELLKELSNMGKTILISSHILTELAGFCNKIAIIEQGKLVVSGDVDKVVRQCKGGLVIRITLVQELERALQVLGAQNCVSDVRADTDNAILATYVGEPRERHELLKLLVMDGFKVLGFEEADVDLQDVYMRLTAGVVS